MQDLITEEYTLEVIPSTGTEDKDWTSIEKKLESLKGIAKTIHVDILDGKFTNNTTPLDPTPYKKFEKDFVLEVHLMVEDPKQYLKPFADAGFKRFIGHVEKMPDVAAFVAAAQLLGEVGLAFDVGTDLEVLEQINMDDIDCMTIMTVKAGFSGQQFMENQLQQVKTIHEKSMVPIEVDGGIKDTNILFAKHAGAVRFVATSAIWDAENPVEAFKKLQTAAKK